MSELIDQMRENNAANRRLGEIDELLKLMNFLRPLYERLAAQEPCEYGHGQLDILSRLHQYTKIRMDTLKAESDG